MAARSSMQIPTFACLVACHSEVRPECSAKCARPSLLRFGELTEKRSKSMYHIRGRPTKRYHLSEGET